MGQSADEAANILTNLKDNVGSEIATGIQNYLASGNFESMSQADFDTMQQGIEDAGGAEAYLENALGMTGEEIAAILGEDYLDDFTTAAEGYATAFDTFKDGLLKSVQNAYDDLDDDKLALSVNGQKAIAQAMEDAMVYAGKEGLDTVQSTIDALDEDNIEGFANVLDSMDWDAQGPEDFVNALDEAGVETGLTTEQLLEFGEAMSRVSNAKDFDTLAEKYAEIHKIIDGLETGDTISAEDYEALGEAGQGYFTRMLDGTYKLTEDAAKFYETI
ncbi:MAG: hypothetical protein NC218_07530 [Acetobacter sp.]|nr:hypothetical protein [Acetobacter sp.]